MRIATLDILRCPFCGGRLELVESLFHRLDGEELQHGVLGCHCCVFGVIDGIPVMHLEGSAKAARVEVEGGRPETARRLMLGLRTEAHISRFEKLVSSGTPTYRDMMSTLDPSAEGGYFLYRFSDPSYVVAHPLLRAVGGTVLRGGGRAIDVCGGSGHLTRSLLDLSSEPPVLADLYFFKLWLARQVVARGCEAVCCDANGPLPFQRGAFRYAMCADAFMFIWQKRQAVQEMLRLIDGARPDTPGAVVISHAHNERVWSPSHGNALPPEGYRDLFETIEPRLFAEAGLFADALRGGPLDLSRCDLPEALEADPALAIVASRPSRIEEIFKPHTLDTASGGTGEWRMNPLYVASPEGDRVRFRLRFPSQDYADEFGDCRRYLLDEVVVSAAALAQLSEGRLPPDLGDLARRRVILDLPRRYY